jgi:bacterioferritin
MFPESVELMNKAVADEMAAVHQYMYFHFQCDDQGYDLLADLFRRTAIEEMIHIERFAERILFLKGDVKLATDEEVQPIRTVKEMLEMGRQLEEATIKQYNKWANECAAAGDTASKTLFEAVVVQEERHYDQYDTELDNLARFGDNYLALQSIERSKARAAAPQPTAGE